MLVHNKFSLQEHVVSSETKDHFALLINIYVQQHFTDNNYDGNDVG